MHTLPRLSTVCVKPSSFSPEAYPDVHVSLFVEPNVPRHPMYNHNPLDTAAEVTLRAVAPVRLLCAAQQLAPLSTGQPPEQWASWAHPAALQAAWPPLSRAAVHLPAPSRPAGDIPLITDGRCPDARHLPVSFVFSLDSCNALRRHSSAWRQHSKHKEEQHICMCSGLSRHALTKGQIRDDSRSR